MICLNDVTRVACIAFKHVNKYINEHINESCTNTQNVCQ